jgi:hypothetical protein
MQSSEVHDYARQLLGLHGDKAQLIAAQKAIECERRGGASAIMATSGATSCRGPYRTVRRSSYGVLRRKAANDQVVRAPFCMASTTA